MKNIRIYDTLKSEIVDFIPINGDEVKIYLCGPTVYNLIHVGNARPIIVFDAFRRFLEHLGYKVTLVQNFTDIDDKIINEAQKEEVSFETVAKRYIIEYWRDTLNLKVRAFSFHPKTTNYIDQIIQYIVELESKGYAYKAENGDVYFDVSKFKNYGELSHRKTDELIFGARIEVSKFKRNPLDFVLWKSSKAGEPSWESPWGEGRPGWHIECSVMSSEILGETFDIHAGGNDLIFPHHENERAQAIAKSGKDFAKYWMHNGMIQMKKDKMSKSLGNVLYVRDLLKKFDSDVLKVFILSKHYRIPIDINEELLNAQKISVDRIKKTLQSVEDYFLGKVPYPKEDSFVKENENYLIENLSNDFNTPNVIARIFELSKELNKALDTKNEKKIIEIYYTIRYIYGSILGIFETNEQIKDNNLEINSLMEIILNVRTELRKKGFYEISDYIRDKLNAINFEIKDTPEGTKYSIKN
nr:cysteine--tRNA ligase [Petrotoga sp. 9PWA.NaAc.5.4]